MKQNVVHIHAREIDFNLDIDVELLDIRIFTSTNLRRFDKVSSEEITSSDKKYLYIITQSQLENFESVLDGLAYSRPKLLIAFGVLSFFTQEMFTPFETIQQYSYVGEFNEERKEKFVFNDYDLLEYFKYLKSYLNKKETDGRFIYSLLDRWRKALYMEHESEDNMLYEDEIILSYFHILELLTKKYYPFQKKEILSKIKEFSSSILKDNFLIEGNNLTNEINSKSKLIESLLIPEVSVSSKIYYMLKAQGIESPRLKNFVTNFVKDRNSVAHGRQVYQDRVIFPVPPFFPLIRNKFYSLEFYRTLSAKVISNYIGLTLYDDEWEEYYQSLLPTIEELNQFIAEKKYLNISNKDFYQGTENDITPYTLTFYLINGKIEHGTAIEILTPYINNYTENEDETIMSIWSIIILVDIISDDKLKAKCIEIIKIAGKNSWHPSAFKMRDEMYTLEYLGFETKTLKEMIQQKEIR